MPNDRYRELARRQHRMIAQYAATFASLWRLDGVVLDHDHLGNVVGIERWDKERVKWIQEDATPWFEHVEARRSAAPGRPFAAMTFSRVALPKGPIGWKSSTGFNIIYGPDLVPVTGVLVATLAHEKVGEQEMLRRLVSWATGVEAPDKDALPLGSFQDDSLEARRPRRRL